MTTIIIKQTIEIPPSVNHLYATNRWGGRYMTAKGKDWFEKMQWKLQAGGNRNKMIVSECRVNISLYTARYRDIDNILKAVFDLLQRAQFVENDNLVGELFIKRHKVKKVKEEKIEFEIFEL